MIWKNEAEFIEGNNMKIYVNYNDNRWKKYDIDFVRVANSVVDKKYTNAEISIVLTNDDEIHALNKKYRNIDKPTNVLSFELEDDILLGDIYIALDTVAREAKEANISIEDHTAHMIVHGVLHLLGYDHIKEEEAKVMEAKEIKILKKIGIKNPYATDSCIYSDSSCCPGSKIFSFFKKIKIRKNSLEQYVLLALLGVGASLGFAPFYMWWVTLLSIACAYKLIIRSNNSKDGLIKNFLRALPFSATYSMCMFWWVLHSIYVVPELTAQFAIWTIPALLGIGVVGGIIFAIPFVVISCMRTIPACRAILFATIWAFVLWLREWLCTGFPWNPIANITMPFPIVANSMAFWGAIGLSFVIIGTIVSLVEALSNKESKTCWMVFGVFSLLFFIGILLGENNMKISQNDSFVSPVVRIVQPAQSAVQKASHSRIEALKNAEENIKNLILLASDKNKPDLIVFPETSYPLVVVKDDVMPIATALDANVLIGTTFYDNGGMYNSMLVVSSDGVIQDIYSKSHLVPFGEYRPFGDIIPTPGQLSAGQGPKVMSINLDNKNFSFVPAICYEIIFSDSLFPKENLHIDAIINITNDTWFGKTPGTYQHLDMVRRYAIESGVPIIRANYSGISAFVAANGEIISSLPIGQAGYLDGFVWGAHNTLYRTIGRNGWVIIILVFSCLLMTSVYALKKHK